MSAATLDALSPFMVLEWGSTCDLGVAIALAEGVLHARDEHMLSRYRVLNAVSLLSRNKLLGHLEIDDRVMYRHCLQAG